MIENKRENYKIKEVIDTDERFSGLRDYLSSGKAVLSAPTGRPIKPIPEDKLASLLTILNNEISDNKRIDKKSNNSSNFKMISTGDKTYVWTQEQIDALDKVLAKYYPD